MKKIFLTLASIGFIGAVVSEVTLTSFVVLSYLSGAVEFLIWIVLIPVLYKAGKKARAQNQTKGNEAVRTSSWLLYGLSIANGIMLFQWGLFNGTGDNVTPDSLIILNGFMFLISAIFMYIDYEKSSN